MHIQARLQGSPCTTDDAHRFSNCSSRLASALGCVLLGILAAEAACRGLREATEWPAASSSSADTSMGHACRWAASGAALHAPALSSRANRVASNDPASWPACITSGSWCHSSHASKQQAPLP